MAVPRSSPRDLDRRKKLAVNKSSAAAPAVTSVSFKKGDVVSVRTPLGRLGPTTMRLVMWLGATVVSDTTDDGHLNVIYSGDFPRDDPFRTVRVATKDVKFPAVAAVDSAAPRGRPTTAGKSLRLLKNLVKETRAKAFYVLVDRYLLPKITGSSLDDLASSKAFMHDVDVYSLPPDELTAKYKHAPTGSDGAKVWYFFCPITKPKNGRTARRSRTIGGDSTKWYHSEGSKKVVNGCAAIGGYFQKFTYKEKTASGGNVKPGWLMTEYGVAPEHGGADMKFTYKEKTASGGNVKPGWLMTEYGVAPEHGGADMVLCKIYMSPRAPSRKRKAAEEEHVDAPPPTVQRVTQVAVEEEETASCSWGAAAPRMNDSTLAHAMALHRSSARDLDSRKKLAVKKAPAPAPAVTSVSFKKGDVVRVRTPLGRLGRTTKRLVMWLGAVVVSAADDDGHLEVIYRCNFPRDDPFQTVRVATTDVKFPASATAVVDNAGRTTRPAAVDHGGQVAAAAAEEA
uniref:NAC domain-containing protein n=1 Tax=Leersia perrieri TaxID=77586 RepID=A0A0D9WZD9_9ORYZ